MIIEKIIEIAKKIIVLIKYFIKTKLGRFMLFLLIIGDLIGLYWINVIKEDYYYPSRYEEALGISFYLILGVIFFLFLLIMSFIIKQKHEPSL